MEHQFVHCAFLPLPCDRHQTDDDRFLLVVASGVHCSVLFFFLFSGVGGREEGGGHLFVNLHLPSRNEQRHNGMYESDFTYSMVEAVTACLGLVWKSSETAFVAFVNTTETVI